MIAAPIMTSSASPTSTGNVLTERHDRSRADTNRPPATRRTGWVEMSERASAAARPRPLETSVRFSIRRVTSYSRPPR